MHANIDGYHSWDCACKYHEPWSECACVSIEGPHMTGSVLALGLEMGRHELPTVWKPLIAE